MKIKIKDLTDSPTQSKTIFLNNFEVKIDTSLNVIVNGNIEINYEVSQVKAKGKLVGFPTFTCSRCTREYQEKIEVEIDEVFKEEPLNKLSAKDIDWDRNNINVFPLKEGAVDLIEVIRDNVIISLPMKPLCSIDCQGFEISNKKGGDTNGSTNKKSN